ncbi:ribonuclease D [Pseudidiomarina mangrovi]|uniref:ribonuclease D n=1 Tax=Pseudidiomarina mangrovi TaxID=2487133 RepID=UPI000FCAE61F|nr:ribonuclease D [Pseudidiomarina mangrovi]
MPYQLITDAKVLADFCQQARSAPYLAIDTEFVRTRTYYAKLGLVQVRAADQLALIDTVALTGSAIQPLWQLLGDSHTQLVIHAGGEDYEILSQQMGHIPTHVFDSQIAAAFAGSGEALGYAALVEQYTGMLVDKSQSRTDWMQRPLAQEQLDYAALDVDYLYEIYPQLLEQVSNKGVADLVLAETAEQIQKRAGNLPDQALYLFFGNAWQCNDQQLRVLRELLIWRQQRARQSDIPLSFVAKDHSLLEMARKPISSVQALKGITDLSPVTVRYNGDAIMAAIARGKASTDMLAPLQRLTDMNGYKAAYAAVKQRCDALAAELDISPVLVASRRQINDTLHWLWQIPADWQASLPKPDLLSGWRGAKLEADLLQLVQR